jgi:iron complex transport system permease protein
MSRPHVPSHFGRSMLVVRLFGDRLSRRLDGRAVLAGGLLFLLALVVAGASLATGYYPVTPSQAATAFFRPEADVVRMIVTEWRLPRIGLALLLGGALGSSGAIFQSLTRNPLGSPDIIGFSAGSYTGALVVMLLLAGGYYEIAAGALLGGILTALSVYLLAWRRGVQGFRVIIVGIGVSAMLSAVNAWMIRQADLNVAMSAAVWGAGSLNGLGAEQLAPVAQVLCVIVPPTLLLARSMRQLEMGDDAARASGVNANRVRLLLMVLGVALTAVVTAAAGPIAFVALAAPQIARRLTRSAGVALVPSALMGSLLLSAADWAAQHAFARNCPLAS